MASLGS
ncbi:hypothetical protein ECPA4_3450, partial [Escherichia coli PA4]